MDKPAEVLARLREERARLAGELAGVERAIAALEGAMEEQPRAAGVLPPAAVQPAPEPPTGPVTERPAAPYAEWDFYPAVALYLASVGKPQTAREIAEGLVAGGFRTQASNFRASARTMLNRHLTAQEFGIFETEEHGRWYLRRDVFEDRVRVPGERE
jgi:hypothetical protein